jgi:hypothetical protein
LSNTFHHLVSKSKEKVTYCLQEKDKIFLTQKNLSPDFNPEIMEYSDNVEMFLDFLQQAKKQ